MNCNAAALRHTPSLLSVAWGTLRFRRYRSSPSLNKGYTRNGSTRHFSKFCSVSLRKTSYIPNVRRNDKNLITKNMVKKITIGIIACLIILAFIAYTYFSEKDCPKGSIKYFSGCSCSYQCLKEIPIVDYTKICKNEPK